MKTLLHNSTSTFPEKQPGVNGFLITASCSTYYYDSAINCARSILDFMPSAKIMICTEHKLFKEEHRELFDVVDLTSPRHSRGKLYALERSPYDITAYIDADCEIQHEDISKIFDQLEDNDIMLTTIREYSAADVRISDDGDEMFWHCGVFLYNSRNLTREFMNSWWVEYIYQRKISPWPWNPHRSVVGQWDQYTFFRLYSSEKFSDIKIAKFPGNDGRWNFIYLYNQEEAGTTDDIVIYHYTLDKGKVNAGRDY